MVRTQIAIGSERFLLAQSQDLDELKQRIEAAVHGGGSFVHFVVVGNRDVSALITPAIGVIFTVETVSFDARDTGDVEDPFGGFFDL